MTGDRGGVAIFMTAVTTEQSTVSLSDIHLDQNGYLADEVPCRKCGYALKGLDPDSACPECGTAIGWSLVGDMLRYSDPEWLMKLYRGIKYLVTYLIISVLAGFLSGMLGVLAWDYVQHAAVSINLFIIFLYIVAVWMITSPEAAKIEHEDQWSARRVTRFGTILLSVLGVIEMTGIEAVVIIYTLVVVVKAVATVVVMIAMFRYFKSLSLRIPDDKLAKHTHIVMWGSVAGIVLIFAGAGWIYFSGLSAGTTQSPSHLPMGIMLMLGLIPTCSGAVLSLVFYIWFIILAFQYRNRLEEAVRYACETWAHNRSVNSTV